MKKKVSKLEANRRLKFFSTQEAKMKTKALDDGSVYFEGWANKAIVDRGGDLITKGEWILDDYKKNPVILFNHDHSQPVGLGINIEAREEGLYIKGRIAKSSDPGISRVRDLVADGVLNSMSVGIYVGDEERTEKANVLKKVQLHEVSIVAVPMNQDSQFSVASKNLSIKSIGHSAVEDVITIADASGHEDLAACLKRISAKAADAKNIEEIADALVESSGIDKAEAIEFLKMNTPETPTVLTEWMVTTEMDEKTKGMDQVALQAIQIPKEIAATPEDVIALAEGTDWKTDNIEESEDAFLVIQLPADDFDGELRSIDLGRGIVAFMGEKKSDEEIPEADPANADPEQTSEIELSAETENKGLLDEAGIAVPLPAGIPDSDIVDPTMDQSRQTNVLLSGVISLLQQISEKLDTLSGRPKEVEEVPIAPEPPKAVDASEEIMKMIKDFETKSMQVLDRI